MFGKKKTKNVQVGMGSSTSDDAYEAAIEAAKEAIKDFEKEPTFSIVYTNADFDQKQLLKGCNEVLGKNWVGSSVDKQIMNGKEFDKNTTISIVSLSSDYLHFGVGIADKYRKSPTSAGLKAVKDAMKNAKADKYIDSYIQFTRAKTLDYSNIVKTPPYFIFSIADGVKKTKGKLISGSESDFLEGMIQATGPNIPFFGLGSGCDLDKFMDDDVKDTKNYQFANGKLFENAAISVFVISNVYFEINVDHGYNITNDYLVITKLHKNRNDILEINGKEPVAEYCRLVGIKKEEFLEDYFTYAGLKRPLGIVAMDGATYIKEAFPNPDGKTLHCNYRLQENMAMNILQYNEDHLLRTQTDIVTDAKSHNKGKKIALGIFSHCCLRRVVTKDHEEKTNQIYMKKHKDVPFFGCYAFSEIGSTKTNVAQVHGGTVTSLLLFDNLLSEK